MTYRPHRKLAYAKGRVHKPYVFLSTWQHCALLFLTKKFNDAEHDNKPQTGKQNLAQFLLSLVSIRHWFCRQKASFELFQFVHVSTTLVHQNDSLFYKKILWKQLSTVFWRSTCTQKSKTNTLSLQFVYIYKWWWSTVNCTKQLKIIKYLLWRKLDCLWKGVILGPSNNLSASALIEKEKKKNLLSC